MDKLIDEVVEAAQASVAAARKAAGKDAVIGPGVTQKCVRAEVEARRHLLVDAVVAAAMKEFAKPTASSKK